MCKENRKHQTMRVGSLGRILLFYLLINSLTLTDLLAQDETKLSEIKRDDAPLTLFSTVELDSETMEAKYGGARRIIGDKAQEATLINVEFELLKSIHEQNTQVGWKKPGGDRLLLNLRRIPATTKGSTVYSGTVEGSKNSDVFFVVSDSINLQGSKVRRTLKLVGRIEFGRTLYSIHHFENGIHVAKLRPKLTKGLRSEPPVAPRKSAPRKIQDDSDKGKQSRAQKKRSNVRIAIFYTTKTHEKSGYSGEDLAKLAIEEINLALMKSDIKEAVEYSHHEIKTTEFDEDKYRYTPCWEYFWMKGEPGAKLESVHRIRKQQNADICFFLLHKPCHFPKAFRMRRGENSVSFYKYAFGISHWEDVLFEKSFPHEIAHIFGCCDFRHKKPLFDYAYPYTDPTVPPEWETLLGSDREIRIAYYSNPDVEHPETKQKMGDERTANNAKTIKRTINIVKQFSDQLR